MAERRFFNGEYIFKLGDPADGVYRIRAGQIRLSRDGRSGLSGDEVRAPGEIFGDDGFLTGDARDSDAQAVGDISVDFLRRNEFLAILTLHPQLIAPLFEPVFDLVGKAAAPGVEVAAKDVPEDGAPEEVSEDISEDGADGADFNIRIIPDGKRVRSAVGLHEVAIRRLPFRIGRRADGEGKDTYTDVHLALEDKRPFNLSRRHFSIEEEDGALIIRDFGSYHGTTVNGMTLGGEGRPRTAPLMTGESELIAGKPDSPFRFRIVVD